MIIDSHCHAWETWPYQPPVPDPENRGRAAQLLWEMDQNGVDQALLVSAAIDHNPENNAYGAAVAAENAGRVHQVADVDSVWRASYHQPGAADRLRRVAAELGCVGFTHYFGKENDGWLRSEEGVRFFETAAELNLIASLAIPLTWQADLRRLAARLPTLPILCHHLGGPPDGSAGIGELLASADTPSILVKVSGFYYAAERKWDFPYAETIEIFRDIHRAFGGRRLCWGSDYPVCLPNTTYRQAVEVVRSHCPFLSEEDLERTMGGTLDEVLRTRRPPAS
jgi:predicted TIM-barrel fold metal-dependent hydrolase